MSPLTVVHGHGDDSLIDRDNESQTIEYYFVRGDADDVVRAILLLIEVSMDNLLLVKK
jgi:hypothetical protein